MELPHLNLSHHKMIQSPVSFVAFKGLRKQNNISVILSDFKFQQKKDQQAMSRQIQSKYDPFYYRKEEIKKFYRLRRNGGTSQLDFPVGSLSPKLGKY